jgi:hypothetical protein
MLDGLALLGFGAQLSVRASPGVDLPALAVTFVLRAADSLRLAWSVPAGPAHCGSR